jgi:hypothetical protein
MGSGVHRLTVDEGMCRSVLVGWLVSRFAPLVASSGLREIPKCPAAEPQTSGFLKPRANGPLVASSFVLAPLPWESQPLQLLLEHIEEAPGFHLHGDRPRAIHADVSLARGEGLRGPSPSCGLDVLHLGERLAPQELFGHVLWRETEARALGQLQPRRLRSRPGRMRRPRRPRTRVGGLLPSPQTTSSRHRYSCRTPFSLRTSKAS